jgi:P27 family predicted phage terminase small subunit
MRGRKPKPIELRVLHGDARERAYHEQPQPRRVLPRCPEHLQGEAAKCWHRLARELFDAGLLTTIDKDALASYCTAYARWRKAEEMLAQSGEIIVTKKILDSDGNVIGGGNVIQNPWLAVANRALEQMSKLAAEFGMTPSSRSRVKAEISAAKEQKNRVPRLNVVKHNENDEDPRKALGM